MLFFNKTTQSIVMFYREEYYDMRTGKPFLGDMELIPLKPFKDKNMVIYPDITNTRLLHKLEKLPEKFHFNCDVLQISGNFPRYFFKGLIKMLCGKE